MSETTTALQPHSFGQVAKDVGLVNDAQIEEALRRQKVMRLSNAKARIGEVLIAMNVLNVEQVKNVLSEQRKRRNAQTSTAIPMQNFGEYKLLSKLGEGGMGAVYKAQDSLAKRVVALKVLRKNLASNQAYVERFNREASLASTLQHPNIVACHSAGIKNGVQYLAMEFVDGETLKDRLEREGGKLPEKEVLELFRQIALGLAQAHSKSIVHRDLKPENIMLDKSGTVKIGDFGTAKSFLDEESLTATGIIVGTPHYISPEQVRAEKIIDHRADLYALGALMYQLLSGQLPFQGGTTLEIMRQHLEVQPKRLSELNPSLSPAAIQITDKLLAKPVEQRYQSAQHLAEDLGLVLEGKQPQHLADVGVKPAPPAAPVAKAAAKKGCAAMLLMSISTLAVICAYFLRALA